MTMTFQNDCTHERIYWYSGQEGVAISLNGDEFAECLDCHAVARTSKQTDNDKEN